MVRLYDVVLKPVGNGKWCLSMLAMIAQTVPNN